MFSEAMRFIGFMRPVQMATVSKYAAGYTLRAAPVMTATEEIFTEDSARAAQFMLWAGRLKSAAINIQKAYSFAWGSTAFDAPNARSKNIFDGNHYEQQRKCNAYGCQSNIAVEHSDIGSIHNVIDCFCQQCQGSRDGKIDDCFRWFCGGKQGFFVS